MPVRENEAGAPADERGARRQRAAASSHKPAAAAVETKEVGGPQGPEPTRYGDWEKDGRCIDF